MEDQLDEKLDQFQRRLDAYLQHNQTLRPDIDPSLQQTREELSGFSEELQVAVAELRQKNLELAQSRNQVEAERARYHELFEFAPDGYLETNGMGIIIEANQAAAEMLAIQTRYLTGKPLANYIAEDERKAFRSWLVQLLNDDGGTQHERREVTLKPRHRSPVEVSATVKRSSHMSGDRDVVLRWMLHDISEMKYAQRALQLAHDELEVRVEARTNELMQANRQLEAKNQELQEFAFIASHDLQEPLRKIKAFGEMLVRRPIDETGRDFLDRMIDASARMQTMLDGLLEYARVNYTGKDFTESNLNELAREVVNDLEYRIMQAGGRVELGELPSVEADPSQIYRLFQNLIANSLKFHRPDIAPQVRISAEETADNVVLRFKDNGVGFDEQLRDRLFLPFSRLQGRSQYEGSGMGLAICRKIVERHAGRIAAEGRPGEGAVFTITLPKKQSA